MRHHRKEKGRERTEQQVCTDNYQTQRDVCNLEAMQEARQRPLSASERRERGRHKECCLSVRGLSLPSLRGHLIISDYISGGLHGGCGYSPSKRDQEGCLMCYTVQESPKLAGFEMSAVQSEKTVA